MIREKIPLVKVGLPPKQELMPKLEQVLYSGVIAEGEAVYEFERLFWDQFGSGNVGAGISLSSGTAALHCALTLSGISAGDEVITTSMTAEPTNLSILHCGAIPVFADVDVNNGNICPESVRRLISPSTKAIIVVHYAGIPVDMDSILSVAGDAGIPVIEDCAHALGARYDNKPVGTLGDFGIFSFQAIKHMTTIDGGFLFVKDPSVLDEARRFRWFGMEKGVDRSLVDISNVGYKYNMQNVSATVGIEQLKVISERILRHRENGEYFDLALSDLLGIRPASFDKEKVMPSYWLYTIVCDDAKTVERVLNENGVSASPLHKPNHLHSIFSKCKSEGRNLDSFYKKKLHIPCGWWLSEDDRELIVDILKGLENISDCQTI